MKLKQLIIVFFILNNTILAQIKQLDSLRLLIKNAKHDTTRLAAAVAFSNEIYSDNPDTVIPICKSVIKFIDDIKTLNKKEKNAYALTKSLAYFNMGLVYFDKGQKELAFENWNKCLEIENEIGNKEGITDVYAQFGYAYSVSGNSAKAIEYYLKSLKINEVLNDKKRIALVLNGIGYEYEQIGDTKRALNYYQKNLSVQKEINDEMGMAYSYNNIAGIYYHHGNPDCIQKNNKCDSLNILFAIDYLEKSLVLFKRIEYSQGVSMVLLNLGIIYQKSGDINCSLSKKECLEKGRALAILKFKEGLNISQKNLVKHDEADALIKLADCFFEQKKINEALSYANKGYFIAKDLAEPTLIKNAAKVLSAIYTQKGDGIKALEMYRVFIQMRDSINNIESQKEVIHSQYKYDFDKKTTADSLKTVKDKAVLFVTIEKERNQKLFLIVLFFVVIAFAAFVYNRFRLTNLQKKTIEQINLSLESANKDLGRQHLLNQKIFSVISHDFRGPMLSLNLMLDSFKTKSTDTALIGFVQSVNNEVNNANEILNNLLNWARTEINIKDFEKHNCNVLAVYTETCKEFYTKLAQKRLTISSTIAAEDEIKLPPDILRIALRNLFSNAIKFSHADAAIEVAFYKKTGSISITDYGIGMDDITQRKLFKQDVDTALGTNNEEGFGVGLYIVSELLNKYYFDIQVESQLGKGSCFILLPKQNSI